jgi:hypothetical protein
MRQGLALLFLFPALLSGCSSNELSYDPVELIGFENCLNTIPPNFTAEIWAYEGIAENYCEDKKPLLK